MALPSLVEEIDRLFDELVRRPWSRLRQVAPMAVKAVEDGWLIEVPVSGLQASDIEVELHGRRLTIAGGRRTEHRERQGGRTTARARHAVSLLRTITLPVEVDPEGIEARVEGSTLIIHIRKRGPWRKLIKPTSA
ncbi:Hsp20/alpha crystallin family protein [Candidatus Binatia bacterium]|nr:Hsp20/alpha crystallin family protein [Candidatus Binatia bacterium]